MVVIISDSEDLKDYRENYNEKIEQICDIMIKMEDNIDGFNKYETKHGVELELESKSFLLVVYAKHEYIDALIKDIEERLVNKETKREINYHINAHHYSVNTSKFVEVYTKIKKNRQFQQYIDNLSDVSNADKITWYIKIINDTNKAKFLYVSEICTFVNFNSQSNGNCINKNLYLKYLSLSPFTIIWDKMSVLNQYDCITKQLDYPYIDQFKFHNNIIKNTINYFKNTMSCVADLHIFISFIKKEKMYDFNSDFKNIKLYKDLNFVLKHNFNKYKTLTGEISFVETNGNIYDNCFELIDNKDETLLESNKIYRCFITNVPLFNTSHVIKIEHNGQSDKITKHILCSNIAFNGNYGNKGSGSLNLINALTQFYLRLKISVVINYVGCIFINTIDKVISLLNAPFNEETLLRALVSSSIRVTSTRDRHDRYLPDEYHTNSVEYPISFVGSDQINDALIIAYQNNPDVVLFGIKLFEIN